MLSRTSTHQSTMGVDQWENCLHWYVLDRGCWAERPKRWRRPVELLGELWTMVYNSKDCPSASTTKLQTDQVRTNSNLNPVRPKPGDETRAKEQGARYRDIVNTLNGYNILVAPGNCLSACGRGECCDNTSTKQWSQFLDRKIEN